MVTENVLKELTITRMGMSVDGQEVELSIPLIVHPNFNTKAIIINYPGRGGDINGYNDKYLKIAQQLQRRNVGAVIQMGNIDRHKFDYSENLVDDLRSVIEYAIRRGPDLCNSAAPDIYLMGFSAGASAVAAVCSEYAAVKKILLVAPSGDANRDAVEKSLGNFEGDVCILIGQDDDIVGVEAGKIFKSLIGVKAKRVDFKVIAGCGHYFEGSVNGKIFRQASRWAFAGDKNFPSPKKGVAIY